MGYTVSMAGRKTAFILILLIIGVACAYFSLRGPRESKPQALQKATEPRAVVAKCLPSDRENIIDPSSVLAELVLPLQKGLERKDAVSRLSALVLSPNARDLAKALAATSSFEQNFLSIFLTAETCSVTEDQIDSIASLDLPFLALFLERQLLKGNYEQVGAILSRAKDISPGLVEEISKTIKPSSRFAAFDRNSPLDPVIRNNKLGQEISRTLVPLLQMSEKSVISFVSRNRDKSGSSLEADMAAMPREFQDLALSGHSFAEVSAFVNQQDPFKSALPREPVIEKLYAYFLTL